MKLVHHQDDPQGGKKNRAQLANEKILAEIETTQRYILTLEESLQKVLWKEREEFDPLKLKQDKLLKEQVIRLDELSEQIGLTPANRDYFSHFMVSELDHLLDVFGYQDKIVASLYYKYAGLTIHDAVKDDAHLALAAELSEMIHFEIDPIKILEKGEKGYMDHIRHENPHLFQSDQEVAEILKIKKQAAEESLADIRRVTNSDTLKEHLEALYKELEEILLLNEEPIDDYLDKNGKFSQRKFAAECKTILEDCMVLTQQLEDSRKRPKTWFKEMLKFIKETVEREAMENLWDSMIDDMHDELS